MNIFLLKLLELSLQAGMLTLAILLLRLIFRKFPAKYLCLLWAIVAIRLMVPFSFESSVAPMWSLTRLVEKQQGSGYIWGELVSVTETYEDGTVKQLYPETDSYKQIPMADESTSAPEEGSIYVEFVDTQVETTVPGTDSNDEADYYLVTVSPTPVPEGISNVVFGLDWGGLLSSIASVVPVLFVLWVLGVILLFAYGVYGCVKVKRMVKNAIPYEDNIWLCDGLDSPFLFGWLRPQIYLPTSLEEEQMRYVILHEKAHIARKDNYKKLIGYILLAVYWFNPLIWVAYIMFCKDVERACDERVISGFGPEDRKGYADALLKCSIDHRFAISNPLAFGEMDVKNRIVGIVKYRKPGKWIAVVAMLLCLAAVAGCFMVHGEKENTTPTILAGSPTPTPAPTSVPPEVTPTPIDPTPTQAVVKFTPTPLPPSDSELLGAVTPETVLPVPMGQTVEVDLDGDGEEETITCGYEGYENGKMIYNIARSWKLREQQFYLNIDGKEFRENEIREEYWNDGLGFTTYYIFDVDMEDKYKEIGLYFSGPSGDPNTALYRYIGGNLYCVGVFESAPLESDYSWNSREYENFSYEEMVQNVNREEFDITVPGDGTILCGERTHFFETTGIVRKYELWNTVLDKNAYLKEIIRDRYEFTGWESERGEPVRAARKFTAYFAPVDMTVEVHKDIQLVTIPKDARIAFYAYYPDNAWTAGWVQFFYGENLEQSAWIYRGVDITGKSLIYLPNETEKNPDALFKNLSHAG